MRSFILNRLNPAYCFLVFCLLFGGKVFSAEEGDISANIKKMKSKNKEEKVEAIRTLAKSKKKEAVQPLRDSLKTEKDAKVREEIVESFAYMGNVGAPASADIINSLSSDTDLKVRKQAAFSLKYVRDAGAVPVLGGILLNMDEEISLRMACLETLASYEMDSAYTYLVSVIKLGVASEQSSEIAREAIFALGRLRLFKAEEKISLLTGLLNAEDEGIRKAVQQMLDKLQEK